MAILSKKTVTGVTARLAKVAEELRAIEKAAEAELIAATNQAEAAAKESTAAGTIASNIEKLLGQ
jgi:hypothetical protein